jgi:hypothetical protein
MAIHSIWDNDFYDKSPVPVWSFEMDFTQLFVNQPDEDYAETLNKAVVSCTWPERNINAIPVYFAGVEGKLPGRAQNSGELEIKFNENTTFKVTKILEELFHAESVCDSYFKGQGGYSFNKNFTKVDNKGRRTIRMIIINPTTLYELNPKEDREAKKHPVIIEFHNCWVTKLGSTEMSYDNDTEVITKSATFAYDYFQVLGGGDTQINDTCKGDN